MKKKILKQILGRTFKVKTVRYLLLRSASTFAGKGRAGKRTRIRQPRIAEIHGMVFVFFAASFADIRP